MLQILSNLRQKDLFYIEKGALLSYGLHYTSRLSTLSGCHEEALGMENGKIPDSAIRANYQVNGIRFSLVQYIIE